MAGDGDTFNVALAEAQRRGLRPISGGDGEAAPPNPWAAYGLDPEGKPKPAPDGTPPAPDVAAELTAVKTKLAAAEAQLAKLPDTFSGMAEKLKLVDRLQKAFGGDTPNEDDPRAREVWKDFLDITKRSSPEVYRHLKMLEDNPGSAGRQQAAIDALAATRLGELNIRAHERIVAKAKTLFKGYTAEELVDAVVPYEEAMTAMINRDPAVQRQYVSGNLKVVDDMFDRLHKPHAQARIREKQARLAPTGLPKASPKGGSAVGGDKDTRPSAKDFSPAGQQAFYKDRVGKWLDKASGQSDDA